MCRFRFAGAIVTTPWGDTYVDIPASVDPERETLSYTVDGVEHTVAMERCWTAGRRGYGLMDLEGREWGVKRSGGCGCG